MRKIKSPKVRLAVSLLKIFGIILLVAFVVWTAKTFDIHPALTALLVLLAGGIIRFLYRLICAVAAIAIFILIICALCLI